MKTLEINCSNSKAFATIVLTLASWFSLFGQVAPTWSHFYTEVDVESYVLKWHIGGAAVEMVSDEFCDMVFMDPDVFLTVMARHNDVFEDWLKQLPDRSFVDSGGHIDYEARKRSMINSLKRLKAGQPYDGLKEKLLATLTKLKIRKID